MGTCDGGPTGCFIPWQAMHAAEKQQATPSSSLNPWDISLASWHHFTCVDVSSP